MKYKTITLELIQQHSVLHDRLCRGRSLLPTMDRLSAALKLRHEAWKLELASTRPQSPPELIASEALELAIGELQADLRAESRPSAEQGGPLSLETAMAYLKHHTPTD